MLVSRGGVLSGLSSPTFHLLLMLHWVLFSFLIEITDHILSMSAMTSHSRAWRRDFSEGLRRVNFFGALPLSLS